MNNLYQLARTRRDANPRYWPGIAGRSRLVNIGRAHVFLLTHALATGLSIACIVLVFSLGVWVLPLLFFVPLAARWFFLVGAQGLIRCEQRVHLTGDWPEVQRWDVVPQSLDSRARIGHKIKQLAHQSWSVFTSHRFRMAVKWALIQVLIGVATVILLPLIWTCIYAGTIGNIVEAITGNHFVNEVELFGHSWAPTVVAGVMSVIGIAAIYPLTMGLSAAINASTRSLIYRRSDPMSTLESSLKSSQRQRDDLATEEFTRLAALERDLHDGPQQSLVRLGMDLTLAERRLGHGDSAHARELIASAGQLAAETLAELRQLVRGFGPASLAAKGLAAAVKELGAKSIIPTKVTVDGPVEMIPNHISQALYFVCAEALANTAKHAGATRAHIHVSTQLDHDRAYARIRVSDDGCGGASLTPDGGLMGLQRRITALGGSFSVGVADANSERPGTALSAEVEFDPVSSPADNGQVDGE